MPIIEYICECGEKFDEIILSFSNVEETHVCPKCNKTAKKAEFPSTHGFNATDLARARK